MRVLIRAVVVAALAAMATGMPGPGSALASPAMSANGGGCYPVDYTWICVYSGGSGGKPGSHGTAKYTCTYTKASAGILERTGTGPPQPGYQWDIMTCPGSSGPLNGELVEVSIKTGAPAISPLQLLEIAIGHLRVPSLEAFTAPPRGKDGLVGLPEWFWVPASQWHRVSVTVSAGPVWATAIARPTAIAFAPGGGLPAVACPGPGIAFDPALPASQQQTSCSYLYAEPSAGQPGNAYQVALIVTWTISWTGSGGAGGVITTAYATETGFGLRVAQGEALVTSP